MTSSAVTGFGVVDLIAGNGTVGETNQSCFNITGNDATDPLMQGEYFITMYSGTTASIQGYLGAANDQTAIQTFVDGTQNSGATTVCTVGFCGVGIVNYGNMVCATP
jgi:hypothetical protein